MAEAQKKTVPFPGTKESKEVPIVNMTHPMSSVVERFLVPAAWFAGGIVFAKIFLRSKTQPPTFGGFQ